MHVQLLAVRGVLFVRHRDLPRAKRCGWMSAAREAARLGVSGARGTSRCGCPAHLTAPAGGPRGAEMAPIPQTFQASAPCRTRWSRLKWWHHRKWTHQSRSTERLRTTPALGAIIARAGPGRTAGSTSGALTLLARKRMRAEAFRESLNFQARKRMRAEAFRESLNFQARKRMRAEAFRESLNFQRPSQEDGL